MVSFLPWIIIAKKREKSTKNAGSSTRQNGGLAVSPRHFDVGIRSGSAGSNLYRLTENVEISWSRAFRLVNSIDISTIFDGAKAPTPILGHPAYMLHAFITLFLSVSISYVECRGRVAQIPFCHCEPRPLRIVMVGVWQSHYISNELSRQYCCFLSFCCPALISIFKINNIHPRWDFFCSSFSVPKNCSCCC